MNTATGAKILSANPGQIYLGTSAATANTGYFQSINLDDSMFLVCVVAAQTGNFTTANASFVFRSRIRFLDS